MPYAEGVTHCLRVGGKQRFGHVMLREREGQLGQPSECIRGDWSPTARS